MKQTLNTKTKPESCLASVSGSVILPSDLRSGNTIEYFISTDNLGWLPTVVDWQDIRLCHEQNEGFNLEHRKIPITEEYLLSIKIFENEPINNSLYCIYRNSKNNKFEFCLLLQGGVKIFLSYLKYVNEFENIFHSLEGRELTDR